MKNVLHVHSGNLYGGVERMLVTIATVQQPDDDVQHTFALCWEGRLSAELESANAVVLQLGGARLRNPLSIRRARARLQTHLVGSRPHALVCHGAWAMVLFGAVAKRNGIKLVLFLHDLPSMHWLEAWSRRTQPDVLICNSAYTSKQSRRFYSAVNDVVIHPPMSRITVTGPVDRTRVRTELNAGDDDVVIVHVSRFEAWKGHAQLLHALGKLNDVSGWTLWIVGGPQRREEFTLLRGLRDIARENKLEERVQFIGERGDVHELLQAADIFCQANTAAEPFGLSMVEAMAAGLPVVTTRFGGTPDLLGTAGVVVAPNDVDALADALRPLIIDSHSRAIAGAAGPARAMLLCDPRARMRELAAALA